MELLSSVTATQLGITAAKAAISRAGIQPFDIRSIHGTSYFRRGRTSPSSSSCLGLDVLLKQKLHNKKVAASGMKSVIFATQTLQLGNREVMLAGGMER